MQIYVGLFTFQRPQSQEKIKLHPQRKEPCRIGWKSWVLLILSGRRTICFHLGIYSGMETGQFYKNVWTALWETLAYGSNLFRLRVDHFSTGAS